MTILENDQYKIEQLYILLADPLELISHYTEFYFFFMKTNSPMQKLK